MDKVEGFLEVGNDGGEVVINHPDLKPDEHGVGHIVFSPNQARNLANLLTRHAFEAEKFAKAVAEAERLKNVPSVDRSKQCMTDGSPVKPDHREIDPATGMQKGYIALCPEERAKGFVRPVRRSYKHVGIRPKHPVRDLTPEEQSRYDEYGYVKFEPYPEGSHARGRFWTQKQLNSGCGQVTTMGLALAETYARDPGFYSGTFCATCRVHLPLEEFVWQGTDEVVGS